MDTRFSKNSRRDIYQYTDDTNEEPTSKPTIQPTFKPVEQPSFMLLNSNIQPVANDAISSGTAGFAIGASFGLLLIPIIIMIILLVWPAVSLFTRINADESWFMWILSLICAIICAPFYTAYAVVRYISFDGSDTCKFSFISCKK
jgi:ABC-type Na+ efflux pump permease subunit